MTLVLKTKSAVCVIHFWMNRELVSTPSYRIRKERKAGILVSPKEVEVIAPVDSSAEPTFAAPSQGPSQPSTSTLVTAEQFGRSSLHALRCY